MQATISTKYQIVIPSEIRKRLRLKPRQKLTVLEKGGVLYLVPEGPLKNLREVAPWCRRKVSGRRKIGIDAAGRFLRLDRVLHERPFGG